MKLKTADIRLIVLPGNVSRPAKKACVKQMENIKDGAMKCVKSLLCLVLILSLMVGCAGRTPSPKTAQSTAKSFFKSYAHKFPDSNFGHKNVQNVTISQVEEVSHNFALVDSVVDFADGHQGRSLLRMQNKFPRGWRVVSWEMLGYR